MSGEVIYTGSQPGSGAGTPANAPAADPVVDDPENPPADDDEGEPEEQPADEPETPATPQQAPIRRTYIKTPLRKAGERVIAGVERHRFDKNTVINNNVKVDTPTEPEKPKETEPEVLITAEDYKQEANDNVDELQEKVGNVINNNGVYYNIVNGKRYNYIWDPFEHKWLSYDPDDMRSGKSGSKADKTISRIQMILAALKLGLTFTVNPNICKDSNGNFYDYDETTGTFRRRAK